MARQAHKSLRIPKQEYTRRLRELVQRALREDMGTGDATVRALRLSRTRAQAAIVAKSTGVLAGLDAVEATFRALDTRAAFRWMVKEGKRVRRGQRVGVITATPAALLSGERTALNFISRLSGVATSAHALAEKLVSSNTRLLDTRKTTPGWRLLEKKAATIGGAVNHRIGLFDALMIKSNHVIAVGDFAETVRRAVHGKGKRTLVCEVRTMAEIHIALAAGVDWLLLDHFRGQRLRQAITTIRAHDARHKTRTTVEVSGNITVRNIARIAAYGPDFVSSGAITHSPLPVDYSLTWMA